MSELYLTTEKFTEKLKKLNPKKAAGHDNITTKELKLLSEDMHPCLFSICLVFQSLLIEQVAHSVSSQTWF